MSITGPSGRKNIFKVLQFCLSAIIVFLLIGTKGPRCGGDNDIPDTVEIIGIYPLDWYYLPNDSPLCFTVNVVNNDDGWRNIWVWGETFGSTDADTFFSSNCVQIAPRQRDTLVLTAGPFTTQFPSGEYEMRAYMDATLLTGDSAEEKGMYPGYIHITDTSSIPQNFLLKKYSGDRQSGRLNEYLNDTVLYKIRAQVTKNDTGCDNIEVDFTTNKCVLWYNDTYTKVVQGIKGIAEAVLKLTASSTPDTLFDYNIKVSSDSCSNNVIFQERCANDNDNSNLQGQYTHKLYHYPGGSEILGDLIVDSKEAGYDNEKRIKLEVDYDPNVVTTSQLDSILNYAKSAMQSAKELSSGPFLACGSGVTVEINPDHDTITFRDEISDDQACSYLAQYRDYNDHMHCFIGTRRLNHPYCLGSSYLRINYGDTCKYNRRTFFIGHGSSSTDMVDSLAKCGVFVWGALVKDTCSIHHKNFSQYAGMTLAHEIGHCLMLHHTNPVSFGKNFMEQESMLDIEHFSIDSFNFFNIKSLDDAEMPIGSHDIISGLTTQEQGGVNTTGFNYFDVPRGGKMIRQVFNTLIGLSLLSGNPISLKGLNQIMTTTKEVLMYGNPASRLHGSDIICDFESVNCIGIAWLEEHHNRWYYNYVRFDTLGNILLDMRNFKTSNWYTGKYGIDWENGVPHIDYVVHNNRNTVLIYSYDTDSIGDAGWRIGYVAVDSVGKIINERTLEQQAYRSFLSISSKLLEFHLIWLGYTYSNSRLKHPVGLGKYYKKPIPHSIEAGVELECGDLFFLGYNPFSQHIHTQRISDKGELIGLDTLIDINIVASISWENVDIPSFREIFWSDSLLLYIQPYGKSLVLVVFDKDGRIITPKQQTNGKIINIDQMPRDAKRFLKIRGGIVYYFGIDKDFNLYCWKSNNEQEK